MSFLQIVSKVFLALGVLVMPFIFSWSVVFGSYSNILKVIAVAWAIGMTTLMPVNIFDAFIILVVGLSINGLYQAVKMLIAQRSQVDKAYKLSTHTFHIQQEFEETESLPLSDRRHMALFKLAQEILDDSLVDYNESKKLLAWFKRYPEAAEDRRTKELCELSHQVLEDNVLDETEALELFVSLSDFCDKYSAARNAKPKRKPSGRLSGELFIGKSRLFANDEYLMNYQDANGRYTERNIILRNAATNKNNEAYISGYCLLRHSNRTFKANRIKMLCHTNTGEILAI